MCRNWPWGPWSIKLNGYQSSLLRGWRGWVLKLNTHLHLLPRLRIKETLPPYPYIPSWWAERQSFLQNRTIIKNKIDFSNKPGAWMWDANSSGRFNRCSGLISGSKSWHKITFNRNLRPPCWKPVPKEHCGTVRTAQTLARLRQFGLLTQSEAFLGVTTIVMHLSSAKCQLYTSRLQFYRKCSLRR